MACGSTQGGVDESAYLRAGVNPSAEATRLERQYRGYRRTVRIDAETYSAFAMEDRGQSLVRVVTERGVALAVEAPEEHGRSRVGLVDGLPPDLDGDGHEEVLVFADDPALDRRCVAIVRIEDGRAREVRLQLPTHGDACIESFADADGDGTAEAIVVVRFGQLALGSAPSVNLVYGAPAWRERLGFRVDQRDVRNREWDTWEEAYRAAVELAALADPDDALATFQAAIEGWEMTSTRQLHCDQAVAAISDWAAP